MSVDSQGTGRSRTRDWIIYAFFWALLWAPVAWMHFHLGNTRNMLIGVAVLFAPIVLFLGIRVWLSGRSEGLLE